MTHSLGWVCGDPDYSPATDDRADNGRAGHQAIHVPWFAPGQVARSNHENVHNVRYTIHPLVPIKRISRKKPEPMPSKITLVIMNFPDVSGIARVGAFAQAVKSGTDIANKTLIRYTLLR
jgi:hypothetical protein